MILVAATAGTPAGLDPMMQVLLTIFGAALVTAAAGFIGAAIQGKRDHARWLRQERLAAYVSYLRFGREVAALLEDITEVRERVRAQERRVAAWQTTTVATEAAALIQQNLDATDSLDKTLDALITRADAQRATLLDSSVPFSLLGPRRVADSAGAMEAAISNGPEETNAAIEKLEVEMRRALKITY